MKQEQLAINSVSTQHRDLEEALAAYDGYFSIEMFNRDLWQLPAAEAARRCYKSLLALCG